MPRFLTKLLKVIRTSTSPKPSGTVRVFSEGTACRCGPGFCADAQGLGYIGSCSAGDGERVAAPDCTRCGAPHQSTRGCWLCQTRSTDMTKPQDPEERAGTDFWLRCLREGVRGEEVFAIQDVALARGVLPRPEEILEFVLAQRSKPVCTTPESP